VSRSDLFAVTVLPPVQARVCALPLHVAPAEDEALASWIISLAATLKLSPLALCRMVFEIEAAADREWWRRPSADTLAVIGSKTGIDIGVLEAMTFAGWSHARDDERPERFDGRYSSASPARASRSRRIRICPICSAEDARAYLRLLWMTGWAGVCPKHRIALTGRCPSCRVALYADNLKARRPAELIACRKCGAKLAGDGGEPAHETALHLQQMLLMAKQSGRLTLPRIGDLEWSTMMALIDVLLGTVWIGTALKYRRQLFKRINNDLGLGEDQAERIPWRTNYGGLLILGWLLKDLNAHLRAAVAILHTGHRERLLAQMPDLSGEMRERLRAILLPAAASPAQGKGSWRNWIDTLPESGAALCERALGERYRLRRPRLFALAAIRDGATVPDAAESVGMKPRAIYRLLDCGARHGLEVALARPRRRNNKLSGAQAEMLGRWVASARPHHHRKAIIAQALAMFGIRLNSDEAYAVLRVHCRAKPGRRRRLWKPWPRKYTIIAEPNHDSAPSS